MKNTTLSFDNKLTAAQKLTCNVYIARGAYNFRLNHGTGAVECIWGPQYDINHTTIDTKGIPSTR